jgi:hypothetical protein
VLNRANGRLRLFRKEADFAAFEQVLSEAHEAGKRGQAHILTNRTIKRGQAHILPV